MLRTYNPLLKCITHRPRICSVEFQGLDNGLQLPGVLESVLNDLATSGKNILLSFSHLLLLLWEVDAAFLCKPAS